MLEHMQKGISRTGIRNLNLACSTVSLVMLLMRLSDGIPYGASTFRYTFGWWFRFQLQVAGTLQWLHSPGSWRYVFGSLLVFSFFSLYGLTGSKVAQFFARRPPQPPISQASFESAAFQLEKCLEEHTKCKSPKMSQLPTCLVDVSGSSKGIVKHYLSSPSEKGQYACLSHCWGGPQPFILNQETLNEFVKSVPR